MEPSIWTAERQEYLIHAWQAGTSREEMFDALNQMAGTPFRSRKQLSEKARKLRIKRPEWYLIQQRLSARTAPRGLPKVREPKLQREFIWTPERKEYFLAAWQTGVGKDEIIDTLNRLSGPPITKRQQLADRAKRLRIRRPEIVVQQVRIQQIAEMNQARAENPPPRQEKAPRPKAKPPFRVSLSVIYNHGFQLWQDGLLPCNQRHRLDAINKVLRGLSKEELAELYPDCAKYNRHPGLELLTTGWR